MTEQQIIDREQIFKKYNGVLHDEILKDLLVMYYELGMDLGKLDKEIQVLGVKLDKKA